MDTKTMQIVITIAVIAIMIIAGKYFYEKKNQDDDSKDPEKSTNPVDILKDFIEVMTNIGMVAIDILDTKNLNLSEDEFKEALARKIVSEFNNNVLPQYADSLTGRIIAKMSEEEKIDFVKNYVLSVDKLVQAINNRNLSSSTQEMVKESHSAIVNQSPGSIDMTSTINQFNEE